MQVSVDGKTVQRDIKREEQDEQDYQASLQHGTSIGLGDLTYRLVYTDLNPKQQQRELQEALKRASTGLDKSVMLLSPTPSRNTIDYHGYSIFDANLHGTTSTVSLGYDKSNGKPVAVKMVKCTAAQFNDLRKEIEILGRLNDVSCLRQKKNVTEALFRGTFANLKRSSIGIHPPIHVCGVKMKVQQWASSCRHQQPLERWGYSHPGSLFLILLFFFVTRCAR